MKKNLLLILLVMVMAACGVPRGQLRIRGTYKNMKDADFLIVSTDGGLDHVDTLHVRNGEFEYKQNLDADATFRIIYPNNKQLMIWAHSGDDINIKGDAQNLWNVTVKGNDENELFTEFRQSCSSSDTVSLRKNAEAFIKDHADSPVAIHLLCQYFVGRRGVERTLIDKLYQTIHTAQPKNAEVATLGGLIAQHYALREGIKMPAFDFVADDSVRYTLASFRGKPFVMYFWAGWYESSGYYHGEMHRLKNQLAEPTDGVSKPMEIGVLSYSLDTDSLSLRANSPAPSLFLPTYCDLQGFNGAYAAQLGIRRLPLFVIVGADGKVKKVFDEVDSVKEYFQKSDTKK